jgi:hypothetical protein
VSGPAGLLDRVGQAADDRRGAGRIEDLDLVEGSGALAVSVQLAPASD